MEIANEIANMYLQLTDLEAAWFKAGVFRLLKFCKLFLKLLKLFSSPSMLPNLYLKPLSRGQEPVFSRCGFAFHSVLREAEQLYHPNNPPCLFPCLTDQPLNSAGKAQTLHIYRWGDK